MIHLFKMPLFLFVLLFSPLLFSEQPEYLFILKGRGNTFWKVIHDGIEETSGKLGMKAVILHTDDDQTPEAQLNICVASLARKPKVLVLGAATKNVGIECFKKAASAETLVADIDGNVTHEDAHAANFPLAFSVGSDNSLIGKEAAAYVAKSSSQENPRILVIKGLPGSIVSEKRARGFLDEIKKTLPGAIIVGTPSADWDRMKAMNTALDFMQREPKMNYIFSVSDIMTMGVIEGVRVAAKTEKVKVISVDGIADARNALLHDRMEANIAQLPFLMGKRAVELALAASEGKIRDYNEFIRTPLLTREILERKDEPDLEYLR